MGSGKQGPPLEAAVCGAIAGVAQALRVLQAFVTQKVVRVEVGVSAPRYRLRR
jgi:hypothetical protein